MKMRIMEDEKNRLIKEQEKLYTKLTATFEDKKQFKLLNELIDIEIELEKFYNKYITPKLFKYELLK